MCVCVCVWTEGLAVSCPRVQLSERTPDTSRRNPQNGGRPPPPPSSSSSSLSPLNLPVANREVVTDTRHESVLRTHAHTHTHTHTHTCFHHCIQGAFAGINAATESHPGAHSPSPLHLLVPAHPHIQGSGWQEKERGKEKEGELGGYSLIP